MDTVINSQAVTLLPRDLLGTGGEGTVFRIRHLNQFLAVKVYHQFDHKRERKLKTFFTQSFPFPNQVIAPQSLVYNVTQTRVMGFTMSLLPPGIEEVAKLANRKYRRSFDVKTKQVATLFLDGLETLRKIHSHGFLVGDLSDTNLLFSNQMFWIDVDAWQFDKFPCPVATEQFLDPALYGVDLSLAPVFRAENDWYSFAVLLFKSLLLVHPYGGVHPQVRTLAARAQKRLTVLDPEVTYPQIALPPDILTDELGEVFTGYFKQGKRPEFPLDQLAGYRDQLISCSHCHTDYPKARRQCPVCMKKTVSFNAQPLMDKKSSPVAAMLLLETPGRFVAVFPRDETAIAVAIEAGQTVAYRWEQNQVSRLPLFAEIKGARFELCAGSLAVNSPLSDEIVLYDISRKRPRQLLQTTTNFYTPNRHAIFRGTPNYLFRLSGSSLIAGTLTNDRIVERELRTVLADQTWFTADNTTSHPRLVGLFNLLGKQLFWLFENKSLFELDSLPQLDRGETITDVVVKFAPDSCFLQRSTQKNGIDFTSRDLFDYTGRIFFSARTKTEELLVANVHNSVYAGGVLVHPTDSGVVQENLQEGKYKTFTPTRSFVSSADKLFRFGKGLLVASDSSIRLLELENKEKP